MRRLVLLIMMGLLTTSVGLAETLTWRVSHQYPFAVNFELHSDNRNHAWPGDGRTWLLNNWETHTFTITCKRFEKVCYGAWSFTGYGSEYKYWGQGPNRQHSCTDCCYTCDGSDTREIVLGSGGGPVEEEGE